MSEELFYKLVRVAPVFSVVWLSSEDIGGFDDSDCRRRIAEDWPGWCINYATPDGKLYHNDNTL